MEISRFSITGKRSLADRRLQDYAAGKKQPIANGIVLPKPEQPEDGSLYFKYGKNQIVSDMRIEEMEGHFVILVNGNLIAQFELLEEDWEITGGNIYDADLKGEVLRWIRANA